MSLRFRNEKLERFDNRKMTRSGVRFRAPRLSDAIVSTIAVLILFLRPSTIGEVYSLQVSIMMLGAIAVYWIVNVRGVEVDIPPLASAQILLLLVIIIQAALHAAGSDQVFAADAMKALAMGVVTVAGLFIAILNVRNSRIFFSTLCIVVLISCASVVVSSGLMAVGVRWVSLVVGINDQTSYGPLKILFPYTLSFNLASTPFGVMPRLSGFFREPGILPPFACWAAAYVHMRRWPLILSFMALAASIASLSTLGLPLAAFTGAMILLNRMGFKAPVALGVVVFVAILIWPILYSLDYIGLESKIASQEGSYEARRDAIYTAFSGSNIMFGDGPSLNYLRNDTVNLIGRIRIIGIFGFIVMLLAHALPVRKEIFLIGVIPMVGTFLITQPIAGSAGVFAVCLSWVAFRRIRGQANFDNEVRQSSMRFQKPIDGMLRSGSRPAETLN